MAAVSVPLNKGYSTLVDEEDVAIATAYKFHVRINHCGIPYAYRGKTIAPGRQNLFSLHREIMGLEYKDGKIVDHINGDSLDNRRANLRIVSKEENARNVKSVQRNSNTSKHLGVYRRKDNGNYVATIWFDKVHRYLGQYPTEQEAAEARLKAEKEWWGIHPRRAFAHGESPNA